MHFFFGVGRVWKFFSKKARYYQPSIDFRLRFALAVVYLFVLDVKFCCIFDTFHFKIDEGVPQADTRFVGTSVWESLITSSIPSSSTCLPNIAGWGLLRFPTGVWRYYPQRLRFSKHTQTHTHGCWQAVSNNYIVAGATSCEAQVSDTTLMRHLGPTTFFPCRHNAVEPTTRSRRTHACRSNQTSCLMSLALQTNWC